MLVGGTLLMLWMYRAYLQRSLAIQQQAADELTAEHERDQAAGNGHAKLSDAELDILRGMAGAWQTMTGPPPPAGA